ncbi:glycosyl hydrolase family 16 [Schizosaccharomyces japonicus yFS275]|uniref:Glycosyl hydrolase family 16 n=1 Tax=Schizosaccharomyces japonicus (strain yFS275 / FY16936) TaxID=402676 RepID=B6K6J4_SCHJY|nr:glycosyl hydrolase family 16 [Schizosaccharomyces japonicus yFS275]EEB09148.1 glycosyl hydrolase family 16 [Schizosaccharomyces japonicus yFS275]
MKEVTSPTPTKEEAAVFVDNVPVYPSSETLNTPTPPAVKDLADEALPVEADEPPKKWFTKKKKCILAGIIVAICCIVGGVLGGVFGHQARERNKHPSYKKRQYTLVRNYSGTNFFDGFEFQNITDPTHGFVDYLPRNVSQSLGLLSANSTNVIIRSDSTHNVTAGRPSVRIQSNDYYNQVLVILDLVHMPFGCGTWPAFWMLGDDWPNGGEIDILEGVNRQAANQFTLHTKDGCTMKDAKRFQTGTNQALDCYVYAPDQGSNAGCGVSSLSSLSYGSGFNQNGGGIFALDWRSEGIRAWFFPRNSTPPDIYTANPQPHDWGYPDADFPNTYCDIDTNFQSQRIVFDLTFCGDWAGADSVYDLFGCPSTCTSFVANSPKNFTEAYWNIRSLQVFKGK